MNKKKPIKNLANNLQKKLGNLPTCPGVYFHKNKTGEIIYVGKAAVLRNRVKQYFQKSRDMDLKTKALVSEIVDIDWLETDSEIDALFLEAEMIKRYTPRYNILLRDDKSLIFIRINMKNQWPYISFTRNPADDRAEYFGPYYNGVAIKKALRYLRRIFPYYIKTPESNHKTKSDLDEHLGLSPVDITSNEYKANLRRLISYIKGNRKKLLTELEREMKKVAELKDFEKAAIIRNQIQNIKELRQRIMFGDKEFLDISKDLALKDLTELFNLSKTPIRIEGYDISHLSGTNVVASMVVFKNGAISRNEYRKFKTRTEQNNDSYNINETIMRRFSQKNLKNWGKPNLVLIDGGKSQLGAAIKARDICQQKDVPFIGLAKRDEEIYTKDITINQQKLADLGGLPRLSGGFTVISLPKSTNIIKLLQRIRNESHRFTISYHQTIKQTSQTSNILEEIPGVGPKTRTKLIRKFGSVRVLQTKSEIEIASVVGSNMARKIKANL